jgi:hypothetical protein
MWGMERWTAFTDAELLFLAESIEIADFEGSYGGNNPDLWSALLDEIERRNPEMYKQHELALDRERIQRYRDSISA